MKKSFAPELKLDQLPPQEQYEQIVYHLPGVLASLTTEIALSVFVSTKLKAPLITQMNIDGKLDDGTPVDVTFTVSLIKSSDTIVVRLVANADRTRPKLDRSWPPSQVKPDRLAQIMLEHVCGTELRLDILSAFNLSPLALRLLRNISFRAQARTDLANLAQRTGTDATSLEFRQAITQLVELGLIEYNQSDETVIQPCVVKR